ncbi:MAG: PVC-type heme-binding CxxCH protein [Chitinophagaceae bacterium]
MKKITACLSILIICSASFMANREHDATALSPLDDSLTLILPDDLKAELWAESPQFYNPTNMDVDIRGRIWVTEAANYRNFNNDSTKFFHHPKGDRVMILEDTDGDGKCDKSTVFVEDHDLVSPLGIAVIGNKIIVSCAPNLIIYTDENNDDKPDKKEIFLTGFGGLDHDHSLHSLIAGPDGNWYFNTGNAGPHIVKDAAGWMLRSGSLYTGGTPYNKTNKGGMISDDGKVWVGGLSLRIGPDGKGLKVMGHNFRNSYEIALDSYGNMWQNDNDDQVVTCRTTFLMEGGNAGYFSADGTRFWQADQRPGQTTFTAHWHQDDPGVIPACDNSGAGSPTGIVVNEGDALGVQYRGMLLSADAGRNVIFGYKTEPIGAGYNLKRGNLVTSVAGENEAYVWNDSAHLKDRRKWFRPSDVSIGTDGAMYIADWYDPVVGGHQMKDKTGYGRIYRITPKNKTLKTPQINLGTVDGQIEALKNPAINVRNQAFSKLVAGGASSIEPVKKLLDSDNPYVQARATWLLSKLGPTGIAEVEKLLTNRNPEIRVTAYRALKQVTDILPYANQLASDSSLAVRREVAISLRDIPLNNCREILIKLAKSYDGKDRWYLEALGMAMEGRQVEMYTILKQVMGNTPPAEWSQAFADLTWRLHPAIAVEALKARASDAGLSEAERKKALVALAFIKDKNAANAMTDLAGNNQKDIAEQARWWIDFRKTNDWIDLLPSGDEKKDDLTLAKEAGRKKMLSLQSKLLNQKTSREEKLKTATLMAKDPAGGQLLIELAAGKKLSNELSSLVSKSIFKNPDLGIRVQASEYFQRPGLNKVFSIQAISRLKPEAVNGKAIFAGTCATCHKAGNLGNDLGPELTTIGKKYDRVSLLDAIINPSASIVFGYEPWLIRTKDGQSVYGFLIGDGQTVVIKDIGKQEHVIKAANILSRKKMDASLMPDPTNLGLDEKKLADVAEFLLTQ